MGSGVVAASIVFGDWDAVWVYEELAALAPLYWLDSYGCSAIGLRPAPPKQWPNWKVNPEAYWQGVGSARDARIALTHMRRTK